MTATPTHPDVPVEPEKKQPEPLDSKTLYEQAASHHLLFLSWREKMLAALFTGIAATAVAAYHAPHKAHLIYGFGAFYTLFIAVLEIRHRQIYRAAQSACRALERGEWPRINGSEEMKYGNADPPPAYGGVFLSTWYTTKYPLSRGWAKWERIPLTLFDHSRALDFLYFGVLGVQAAVAVDWLN